MPSLVPILFEDMLVNSTKRGDTLVLIPKHAKIRWTHFNIPKYAPQGSRTKGIRPMHWHSRSECVLHKDVMATANSDDAITLPN